MQGKIEKRDHWQGERFLLFLVGTVLLLTLFLFVDNQYQDSFPHLREATIESTVNTDFSGYLGDSNIDDSVLHPSVECEEELQMDHCLDCSPLCVTCPAFLASVESFQLSQHSLALVETPYQRNLHSVALDIILPPPLIS